MGFKLYTEEFKQKVADAYNSGMKISEVAETFGVSTSAVSSWASGKKDKRLMFTVEQKKDFVKYRIQHNIPYDEMAKRIGVVEDTLRHWESDYFFDVMEEIAKENRRFKKKERFRKGTAIWTYVGTGGYFS